MSQNYPYSEQLSVNTLKPDGLASNPSLDLDLSQIIYHLYALVSSFISEDHNSACPESLW